MLGEAIDDPDHIESASEHERGLGLLPLRTQYRREKITARVSATAAAPTLLGDPGATPLSGYEIHMGAVEQTRPCASPFRIRERNGEPCEVVDGAAEGATVGTMIHGILNNDSVRAALLANLRRRRALVAPIVVAPTSKPNQYDRLAAIVREALAGDVLASLLPA